VVQRCRPAPAEPTAQTAIVDLVPAPSYVTVGRERTSPLEVSPAAEPPPLTVAPGFFRVAAYPAAGADPEDRGFLIVIF
jgi:hypothetical protein